MARRLEVDLGFNYPQWRAYQALFDERGQPYRGRTVFLGWGRGVGKSWFRRQVWWLLVALLDGELRTEALEPFRGVRITSLAPTLKQWKDIHWGGITEELTGSGKWAFLRAKLDHQSGQIRFPGGSVVRPFPATAYNARTARGMRTDVLDADEVDDIDAAVYDGIAVPWLSEPWSLQIELPGGTPTRGRHGLWWRFLSAGRIGEKLRKGAALEDVLSSEQIETYRSILGNDSDEAGADEIADALRSIYAFHATYEDAPETVGRKAVARAAATTPTAVFNREWKADPDAGEGLIYPFNEDFHVIGGKDCPYQEVPRLESFREFHVGMDHGWVNPGVLLLAGIQGHGDDATVFLLDEWYESEVPNHVWDERAKQWSFAKFWPDPSRPDRIHDLRCAGLNVGETDNQILGGIARVADLLFIRTAEHRGNVTRWARLYVSPKCRNAIREFGLYRRKKHSDGSFGEEPEDANDHLMDALRYLCVGRFGALENRRTVVSGR
ncbi:MAG: hypothetical protein DIU78_022165 [Pseudomonadota bacterium]